MKISLALSRNLNKIHWDRRPWQIGYRGPPLAQQKATGRPHRPIHPGNVAVLRHEFAREYQVMRYLAKPYLTTEKESYYISKFGTLEDEVELERKEEEMKKMPGDAKWLDEKGKASKIYANYGNLLHKHRTVEDSMCELIRRQRWD